MSPYFTLAEAADYLRFTGVNPSHACRMWLRRHKVPTVKRGRPLLVLRSSLEASLKHCSPTRRVAL